MTTVPATDIVRQVTAAVRYPDQVRLLRRTAGAAVIFFLLWLLGEVFLLIFAAALLAVALRGISVWIAGHTRWTPETCLVIVSVIIVLSITMGVRVSGPPLAEQGNQLWEQSIHAFDTTRQWLQQFSWLQPLVEGTSAQNLAENGQRIASNLGIALMSMLGALTGVVIAIVTAFYFAAAPGLYVTGAVRLLPKHRRQRGRQFLKECANTLRLWLYGQGISMLLVTVVTYIGLAMLDVPLAPLLALIAGLTNFVPYVGPFVGAAPALVVSLGVGMQTALSVALLFVAIQFFEGNIVQPMVQKRISRLPPALTILSQTIMGTLFGAIGIV
ncbi:MAG: AI-2E family transporter, partial [Pseudomonadota bacterium]|nr:AI-2E family transporter [Pseudomonadota bacterium]